MPVFIPYMLERGVNIEHSLMLVASRSIFSAIFEFPTGVIGDYFGHKVSVVIGYIIFIVSICLFLIPVSFTIYLVITAVMAFGLSLMSGSDTAMLNSISSDFDSEYAKNRSISLVSFAISSVVGGLLGAIFLTLPVYLTVLVNVLGLYMISSVKVPKQAKLSDTSGNIFASAKEGLMVISTNQHVLRPALLFGILATVSYSFKYQVNLVFEVFNLPVALVGFFISAIIISGAAGILIGKRMRTSTGIIFIGVILMFVLPILIPNGYFIALVFVVGKFLLEIVQLRMELKVNKSIDPLYRASALSTMYLFKSVMYSIFLSIIGLKVVSGDYIYPGLLNLIVLALGGILFLTMYKRLSVTDY